MKTFLRMAAGVVLLGGILFGLFVVVFVPFEMWKKAEAETWPSRRGVITKSYASQQRGSAGRHGNASYFRAEICGVYKDSSDAFCVARIRYGGIRLGAGRADALEAVAKYPVGREVEVYFSPADPRETVLEARSPWTEMATLLGLGIGFLLIPVLLWLARKKIAR